VLVLDSIQPEKWYSVKEVAAILGVAEDTVIRQINRKLLKAFILPGRSDKRVRIYQCRRVLGCDLLRYIDGHMNRN
jgi:hypothetical protein